MLETSHPILTELTLADHVRHFDPLQGRVSRMEGAEAFLTSDTLSLSDLNFGSVYKPYVFTECFYEIRGINDHGLQAVSGMALGD